MVSKTTGCIRTFSEDGVRDRARKLERLLRFVTNAVEGDGGDDNGAGEYVLDPIGDPFHAEAIADDGHQHGSGERTGSSLPAGAVAMMLTSPAGKAEPSGGRMILPASSCN